MLRRASRLSTLALGFALCASATAATVYDNFGPGNETGTAGIGIGAFGLPPARTFEYAVAFTVGNTDLAFERLDLALAHNLGPNIFTISVHEAASGLPGLVIGSQTYVDAMPSFGGQVQPVAVEWATPLILQTGHQYWFSVSAPGATTMASWMQTTQLQIPWTHAARLLPDAWFDATAQIPGAFRLVASPVPESPTSLLSMVGLAVCAAAARQRMRADA